MTSPADLAALKKQMDHSGSASGYLIPDSIQKAIIKLAEAGDIDSVKFAYTEIGMTIFLLGDAWHTFKLSAIRGAIALLQEGGMQNPGADATFRVLDDWQEAELRKAGKWQELPP